MKNKFKVFLLFLKVWDVITGTKQYTFEGHGAPVYSVCPHVKERVHVRTSLSMSAAFSLYI